jgi:hypothetical protein
VDLAFVPPDQASILTITKQLSGANYIVTLFINGKAAAKSSASGNADGGTSGSMRWAVGCEANLLTTNRFKGIVDTIRAKTGVRTDSAIATYANNLLYPLTRGTTYTLTCTGVQDVGAVPITGNDAVYVFTYFGVNTPSINAGNRVPEVYYTGTSQRSFAGGQEARSPALILTAQRNGSNTIYIQSTNALANLAATTVPGNWIISGGPTSLYVSSVSFTPGNSFLTLTTTGGYATGTYNITPAIQTVKDAYGQFWSGSISLRIVSTAAGGSNFNTGLN